MGGAVRGEFEFPDEAGYPDGTGLLSEDQSAQVIEIASTGSSDYPRASFQFDVVRDDPNFRYIAIVGDEEVGTMRFELFGSRVALIHTNVEPDYRGQGIASEMIWRVLEDVQARGETISIICPLVRAFVDGHPRYEVLVDPTFPGR